MIAMSDGHFWRHHQPDPEPIRAATGGPPEDIEERLNFFERSLDAVLRRVEALEASVRADNIAPLNDREPNGGGR